MTSLAIRAAELAGDGESRPEAKNGPQNGAQGLLDQPNTDFDGVAVMLLPTREDQARIAEFSGIPANQLHCTLVYLGDAKDLLKRDITMSRVVDAVRKVAAGWHMMEAELGGLIRFSAPGDTDPLVLSVDSKPVGEFRPKVLAGLEAEGIEDASEHGFTPHLTLGYLKNDDPIPFQRWEPFDILFDRVRIGFGEQQTDLRLGEFDTIEMKDGGVFVTKDVYGGSASSSVNAGVGTRVQRMVPVRRPKRSRLRERAMSIVPTRTNTTQISGLKMKAATLAGLELKTRQQRDGDGDGFIYDGKPGMRPAPIGTPISGQLTFAGKADPKKWPPLNSNPDYSFTRAKDKHGNEWVMGPDPDGGFSAFWPDAMDDPDTFFDKVVVDQAQTRPELMKLLDQATRDKSRSRNDPPLNGRLSENPTTPIKKAADAVEEPVKRPPTAKKTASSVKERAAKVAAKKPSTKPKKEKAVPLWQKDWADLTPEEKKGLIEQRGRVAKVNPLTKKAWTPAAIKAKRLSNGPSLEAVVEARKKAGWRLVTDDAERHSLSMQVGKPMPPNWSHVFVYEGPGAEKRKYTVCGIDWAWKVQPHQSPEKRTESLGGKFTRYRALTKKLPVLDRKTKADVQKGDPVATVVRLMMLSGGRVDSGNGKNITGSRGITSLLSSDVTIRGHKVLLNFDAKSGHKNDYQIVDPVLAEALKEMKNGKKPGDQIFPNVTSDLAGRYLKDTCGRDFINHDLRTAVANAAANSKIAELQRRGIEINLSDPKAIKKAVDEISEAVGIAINDTPGTAYNSYIDPAVIAQMIPEDLQPKRGAK